MKKILAIAILSMSSVAFANPHFHHRHGHWRHHGGSWTWVAPVIVGGVVGYEIARNRETVVVQNQPVVQPVVVQQQDTNCGPWIQTQNSDGSVTTTRTCQVLPK